jgi:4-hydroxybenzoate polyprenyltransferase
LKAVAVVPLRESRLRRLWRYQEERFPLRRHGPLILVFSGAAVGYGARLAGVTPRPAALAGAFVVVLLQFLLMRIADEFKDADDDRRWRPERAVPRGLVSLRELAGLGLVAALLQLLAVAVVAPGALSLLAGLWGFFLLMSAEFFRRRWLRARPVLYGLSHLLIVPLQALLALRLQLVGPLPLMALAPFLACCYAGAMLIELARKIRWPAAERPGVETYSALWGFRPAAGFWLAALLLAAAMALVAAASIQRTAAVALVLGPLLVAALLRVAPWLTARPLPAPGQPGTAAEPRATSEPLEALTAVWILATYLSLGWLPWWPHGGGS